LEDAPPEDAPLSLLGVVRRTAALALLAAVAVLAAGRLLGWSYPLAYRRLDGLLFMGGALLFCLGVFRGKPAPPPRPAGAPGAPEEEDDPDALTPSEVQALQRARERAPALATAGLVLILTTQLLYLGRGPLGRLYGYPVPVETARP
jgi:hypothetical protein